MPGLLAPASARLAVALRRRIPSATLVVALLLTMSLTGCVVDAPSAGDVGAPSPGLVGAASPGLVAPPPGMRIVAELGYPRDLYERGRVNLVTSQPGHEPVEVLGKRLLADHFAALALDDHRSVIAPSDQPVALQTRFGTVSDCSSTTPVRAKAELRYRVGDDPTVRRSIVPLADASVLDEIRARRCVTAAVLDGSVVTFDAVDVAGESMDVDVTIDRADGWQHDVRVRSVAGTVLFGARLRAADDRAARRTRGDAPAALTVPLTLVVNRCDGHAVAETTKRYGLDLWISLDGAAPRPVPLPIERLTDELDAMLERCRERTGQ